MTGTRTQRVRRVPVVLPSVEVAVDEAGMATVTVNRTPYAGRGQVGRGAIEGVLDQIADSLGPIRVRVRESDGSEFTDVVLPPASRPTEADAQTAPPAGLAGDGFLPGEDVGIALIVGHQSADLDGRACLRLPPALLSGRTGTLVLLGRASGRFTVFASP